MSTQNIIVPSARKSSTSRPRSASISKNMHASSVPSKAERDATKVSSLGEKKAFGGMAGKGVTFPRVAGVPMQITLTGVSGKRVASIVVSDGKSKWGDFPVSGGGSWRKEEEAEDPARLGVSSAKAAAHQINEERSYWVSYWSSIEGLKDITDAKEFKVEVRNIKGIGGIMPDSIIFDGEVAIWPSAEMRKAYTQAKAFGATRGKVWSVVAESRVNVATHFFVKRMERKKAADKAAKKERAERKKSKS